jgi:hypothetical protein
MPNAGRFNGKFRVAVAATMLLAASGLAWSMSRSATPATGMQFVTASAISPMELMLQHRQRLPTEHWEPF